ncbi:hypothetical protein HPB50_027226 [Hyalomma asiaticum]|uniref:Uncharacterized protein n=1 Tax=Hyalomma asiaticum TaxID=266040 RepID=A0ACB7TQ73_HYAAI|nr:hypothetical protein HPB50_027226 [Hyalomma asiaticum]
MAARPACSDRREIGPIRSGGSRHSGVIRLTRSVSMAAALALPLCPKVHAARAIKPARTVLYGCRHAFGGPRSVPSLPIGLAVGENRRGVSPVAFCPALE